jgi:hypothetical protein
VGFSRRRRGWAGPAASCSAGAGSTQGKARFWGFCANTDFVAEFEEPALARWDLDAATVCMSNRLPGNRQTDHIENFEDYGERNRNGENGKKGDAAE